MGHNVVPRVIARAYISDLDLPFVYRCWVPCVIFKVQQNYENLRCELDVECNIKCEVIEKDFNFNLFFLNSIESVRYRNNINRSSSQFETFFDWFEQQEILKFFMLENDSFLLVFASFSCLLLLKTNRTQFSMV